MDPLMAGATFSKLGTWVLCEVPARPSGGSLNITQERLTVGD